MPLQRHHRYMGQIGKPVCHGRYRLRDQQRPGVAFDIPFGPRRSRKCVPSTAAWEISQICHRTIVVDDLLMPRLSAQPVFGPVADRLFWGIESGRLSVAKPETRRSPGAGGKDRSQRRETSFHRLLVGRRLCAWINRCEVDQQAFRFDLIQMESWHLGMADMDTAGERLTHIFKRIALVKIAKRGRL